MTDNPKQVHDMDKVYIVHYNHINVTKTLEEVTETSFNSLLENKQIRKTLGGENLHNEQCENVPETLEGQISVHPERYKKFSFAKKLLKRKDNTCYNLSTKNARIKREVTSNSSNKELFPNVCMICKTRKLKLKGKDYYPTKVVANI